MRPAAFATVLFAGLGLAAATSANPIPVPVPASMPLEEMTIVVGADRHVRFSGVFTFNSIPDTVTSMLFPLPPANASAVRVFQDGTPLTWSASASTYPTVLPEFPGVAMFEWQGPFPADGAAFTVAYEHDLFQRGDSWVLFYSLGTGKYFPTYDKITTAIFEIHLPDGAGLEAVLLDDTPVDPSLYALTGSRLDMTLTSAFGPFTRDLVLLLDVPAPVSAPPALWLLGGGLLAFALRGRAAA